MLNIKNLQIRKFKSDIKYILVITSMIPILAISSKSCSPNNSETKTIDYREVIEDNDNLLDESKNDMLEYLNAKDEYQNNKTIETQYRYIEAARNLENVAEAEIADELGVKNVTIERNPVDVRDIVRTDNDIYTDIPPTINKIINSTEEIDGYIGGNTKLWNEEDIKNFGNHSDQLLENIINLQSYTLEQDNNKIGQTKR